MSLLAVRQQFIKYYSGRYDLVVDTDDWADNGADFFIRAGQKWLDTTFLVARAHGKYYANVGAGGWYSLIPSARVIYSIWMSDMSEARWEVERRSLPSLRNIFPGDLSAVDRDRPLFYAPLYLRTIPEVLDTITLDQLGNVAYTIAGDIFTFNGILWAPPNEVDILLEVTAVFYQPPLLEDTDQNWWSEEVPQVLCMAASRQLEITYRNTIGVKDWEESIRSELQGHEFDLADSESTGITQLEG
jgi:hypothetical protein